MKSLEPITAQIVDVAVKVHKALGFGLLETAFLAYLSYELKKRYIHNEWEGLLPATCLWPSVPRLISQSHGPDPHLPQVA